MRTQLSVALSRLAFSSPLPSCSAFALPEVGGFSPQPFDSLATIGAILLVSYGVMTSWAISATGLTLKETRPAREWLGFAIGLAFSALLAIAASLATANYIRHEHSQDLLCRLGFWSSVLPIFALGGLLVLQPYFTRQWLLQVERPKTYRLNARRGRYRR